MSERGPVVSPSTTLGSTWPRKKRRRSREGRSRRYAANVLPIIREAQKAGARTLRDIAETLNARGVAQRAFVVPGGRSGGPQEPKRTRGCP